MSAATGPTNSSDGGSRGGFPSLSPEPQGLHRSGQEETPETVLHQKKRFLLFIKILFKSLEQTADRESRERAKEIVADCTRRNRLGDPAYIPLMDAVDRRLRGHIGETHWRRAHAYQLFYLRRSEEGRMASKAAARQREEMMPISQQAEV